MFHDVAPLDILILAAVAGYVLYKFYQQLGTNTEVDENKSPLNPKQDSHQKNQNEESHSNVQPLFRSKTQQKTSSTENPNYAENPEDKRYEELLQLDPNFQESSFLEGASIAYDMIITAIAAQDTKKLKPLVSNNIFDEFCAEIKHRREEGLEYQVDIIGISEMEVRSVTIENSIATLVIGIESEQNIAIYDKNKNLTNDDSEELQEIFDIWHFQRDMASSNPNWSLVYIESDEENSTI